MPSSCQDFARRAGTSVLLRQAAFSQAPRNPASFKEESGRGHLRGFGTRTRLALVMRMM